MRDAPGAFNCPPSNLDIRQTPPTINIVGQVPLVALCTVAVPHSFAH